MIIKRCILKEATERARRTETHLPGGITVTLFLCAVPQDRARGWAPLQAVIMTSRIWYVGFPNSST
jgi:hypothetical protein